MVLLPVAALANARLTRRKDCPPRRFSIVGWAGATTGVTTYSPLTHSSLGEKCVGWAHACVAATAMISQGVIEPTVTDGIRPSQCLLSTHCGHHLARPNRVNGRTYLPV